MKVSKENRNGFMQAIRDCAKICNDEGDRLSNLAIRLQADEKTEDVRRVFAQASTAYKNANKILAILPVGGACEWIPKSLYYSTSCEKQISCFSWDSLRERGDTFPCCPGCGLLISIGGG